MMEGEFFVYLDSKLNKKKTSFRDFLVENVKGFSKSALKAGKKIKVVITNWFFYQSDWKGLRPFAEFSGLSSQEIFFLGLKILAVSEIKFSDKSVASCP